MDINERLYEGIKKRLTDDIILAYEVFKKHNIEIYYDYMVEAIINRNKTGYCPMETAVIGIDTPEEALRAIKKKLHEGI